MVNYLGTGATLIGIIGGIGAAKAQYGTEPIDKSYIGHAVEIKGNFDGKPGEETLFLEFFKYRENGENRVGVDISNINGKPVQTVKLPFEYGKLSAINPGVEPGPIDTNGNGTDEISIYKNGIRSENIKLEFDGEKFVNLREFDFLLP
jgi:hypothetical protein